MRLFALILPAIVAATPAMAREWPVSGGWTVAEGDDFCTMTNEFEGPGDSELFLSMYLNGITLLTDVNSEWSAKEDEVYDDITAYMGGTTYGGSRAVGVDFDGKKGFAIRVSPAMVDAIAAARSIHLYKGETRIDRLNLSGTGAAIATMRRCMTALKADHAAAERIAAAERAAAEREKRRYADMPKNPFAGR